MGGCPTFKEAVAGPLERRMTPEFSLNIALGTAVAIREVNTALLIAVFVLVAESAAHRPPLTAPSDE